MTIIVAYKTDDKIIIGADKRVIEDKIIVSETSSKILNKELIVESYNNLNYEHFLIGFSGAYSLFELLKTFEAPRKDSNDTFMEYLYKNFVPKLHNHLRKYNFYIDYNGQEGVDWELLIAYKNNLFLVEFNLGVIEILASYYAIGKSKDIALGSLYTTCQEGSVTSKGYIVATAIRACAAHHTSCNNKMEIYSIKNTGEITKIK